DPRELAPGASGGEHSADGGAEVAREAPAFGRLWEAAFIACRKRAGGECSAAAGPVGPAALPAGDAPSGAAAASPSRAKRGASRRRAHRAPLPYRAASPP